MSNPLIDAAVRALNDDATFRKESVTAEVVSSEQILSEASSCSGMRKKKVKKEVAEEVEQLDELSKQTMLSYIRKAGPDAESKDKIAKKAGRRAKESEADAKRTADWAKPEVHKKSWPGEGKNSPMGIPALKKASTYHRRTARKDRIEQELNTELANKRREGISRATSKLTKEDQDFIDLLNTTPVEQLDELSKETLKSYRDGAKIDKDNAERMAKRDWEYGEGLVASGNKERGAAFKDSAMVTREVARKRGRGIALASKKILAKEDVERLEEAKDIHPNEIHHGPDISTGHYSAVKVHAVGKNWKGRVKIGDVLGDDDYMDLESDGAVFKEKKKK